MIFLADFVGGCKSFLRASRFFFLENVYQVGARVHVRGWFYEVFEDEIAGEPRHWLEFLLLKLCCVFVIVVSDASYLPGDPFNLVFKS